MYFSGEFTLVEAVANVLLMQDCCDCF